MYEKFPKRQRVYMNNLREPSIEDKLEDLHTKGTNVVEIFYRNYRDWVIWTNKAQISLISMDNLVQGMDTDILDGKPIYGPKNAKKSRVEDFAIAEIKLFKENVQLALTLQNKKQWKYYINHIKDNLWRYEKLDKIAYYLNPNAVFQSIESIAEGKIHNGFVDLKQLERSIKNLFLKADRLYWMNELDDIHPNPLETYDTLGENLNPYFDFKNYKDPSTFQEFPEDKVLYLKTLKTWLIKKLDSRRIKLGFEELPPPHAFIERYAFSLTETPKITTTIEDNQDEINKIEVIAEAVPDYPRFIFKDYKSYAFFNLLARHYQSKVQLSFLYRKMSEKEIPAMIVVKDTPFRKWFNTTEHIVKINSTTDTYDKAKNDDRIATYKISKELFFKD